MRAPTIIALGFWLICGCGYDASRNPPSLTRADGLRLLVSSTSRSPALLIVLPGRNESEHAVEVLFPEHVTARTTPGAEPEHLYLSWAGERPAWRQMGHSIEYERDLPKSVHMLARATLTDDGVLFHYEFTNHSKTPFDMIYAVTDPRMKSEFHDVRLERTYVHHRDGFDLLASEMPARRTMPLQEWLPARYLASFRWPVPAQRVEKRADGITYYYKSRAVDEPFIATLSADRKWVIASFSRDAGNVWSNPELTCQHVDPQVTLPAGRTATTEVKLLVMPATLAAAYERAVQQRAALN
jgi:hypothetical protein